MAVFPHAVQYILIAYLFYTQQFVPLNPLLLPCLPPSLFPSGIQEFVLDTCESVSICLISWIPHISDKYSICISLSNLFH